MVGKRVSIGLFDFYNRSTRVADDLHGNLLIKTPFQYIITASDIRHAVSSGDTLNSIAHKYYGNDRYALYIAEVNNIINPFDGLENQIGIGKLIVIPDVVKIAL